MLKYLGVKDHPVYNLFSNGSEKKNVHIYIERKKTNECGRMLTIGEPGWRESKLFVLFSQFSYKFGMISK